MTDSSSSATADLLKCGKCKEFMDPALFNRNRSTKRGRDAYCKPCRRAYDKNWLATTSPESREKVLATHRKWLAEARAKKKAERETRS